MRGGGAEECAGARSHFEHVLLLNDSNRKSSQVYDRATAASWVCRAGHDPRIAGGGIALGDRVELAAEEVIKWGMAHGSSGQN